MKYYANSAPLWVYDRKQEKTISCSESLSVAASHAQGASDPKGFGPASRTEFGGSGGWRAVHVADFRHIATNLRRNLLVCDPIGSGREGDVRTSVATRV